MRRLTAAVLLLCLALLLSRVGIWQPVHAETLPDNARELLEKSLSVSEIDRDIERVAALQTRTEQEIDSSAARLAAQELAIAAQREKAGRVLRSYYMGYNDFLLTVLLSSRSLHELFDAWDMLQYVMDSDKRTLKRYSDQYTALQQGYDQLRANRNDLAAMRADLEAQRDRLAALQREVDRGLAASNDAELLRRLMQELQTYWKNVGLYEVKQYFKALASAMGDLPAWVRKNPDMLHTKGLKSTLTVTDAQLNEFLRGEDSRFEQFAISFKNGSMTLEGDNGNMQVSVQGSYTVENEPENAIRYRVDKLVFNGLALPDTTRKELEREFDLSFYPGKLIKFLKAEEVELTEGKLTVRLRLG